MGKREYDRVTKGLAGSGEEKLVWKEKLPERLKQLDTFSKHLQSASNKAKSSSRAMF